MLPDPLVEEFKLVVVQYEFENVDVFFDKLSGIFGRSRLGSKKQNK